MGARILVAEDDYATSKMVEMALKTAHYEPTLARSFQQACRHLKGHPFDLILSDLYLGDGTGLDLLKISRSLDPAPPFLVFTAKGSLETAVEAIQEGALDYLAKPFKVDRLLALVGRALDSTRLEKTDSPVESSMMIGNSPPMVELYKKIGLVAPTDSPVLICGETGTGKELVARALHQFSRRKQYPFVPVNCGSLTQTLLESELFGHEKGAFTGAVVAHKGLLESASGGTLFLDEITETDASFQVKLLRFLQEGEIRPVGGNRLIKTDLRVVAAGNRIFENEMENGNFRSDLYYRLSVVRLDIAPLRDRPTDIPQLAAVFLSRAGSRLNRSLSLSHSALTALQSYSWPGNVRELENAIERAAVLKTDSVITLDDLDFLQKNNEADQSAVELQLSVLDVVERDKIISVLKESQGNKAEAARRLNIDRKSLYRKASRLKIDLDDSSS